MHSSLLALPALLACVSSADAQGTDRWPTLEVRPFVGVYVPEGGMRGAFTHATMLGVPAAVEISPRFHVLGSGGWTHGHSRLELPSAIRTHIRHYDVGVEPNLIGRIGDELHPRPFVGLGGGGRTYDYRAAGVAIARCAPDPLADT